jgi:hypothetical protein
MAATMDWLRGRLVCSDSQLVRVICKAPSLLSYSQGALDARLEWWQQLASTPAQQQILIGALRRHPQALLHSLDTLG